MRSRSQTRTYVLYQALPFHNTVLDTNRLLCIEYLDRNLSMKPSLLNTLASGFYLLSFLLYRFFYLSIGISSSNDPLRPKY